MRIILLISFLFAHLDLGVIAQRKLISQETYLQLEGRSRSLLNANVDSSLYYARLIEKSENPLHRAFSLELMSYLFQLKGDERKRDSLSETAFRLLEDVRPSKEKTRIQAVMLNLSGLSSWKQGNYAEALKKYEEGAQLSESIGDIVQLIKFNNNISALNGEMHNYHLAINAAKKSDRLTNLQREMYSIESFQAVKSTIYLNLGSFYHGYWLEAKKQRLVDSAQYYYEKCISCSDLYVETKLSAYINLANLHLLRDSLEAAKKIYFNVLGISKERKLLNKQITASFNLGYLFYKEQKFAEALTLFEDIDSMWNAFRVGELEYTYANFYRALIFEGRGDYERAERFMELASTGYNKIRSHYDEELLEANFFVESSRFNAEVARINGTIKNQKDTRQYILVGIGVLLVSGVGIFVWRVRKRRGKNDVLSQTGMAIRDVTGGPSLAINDAREKEILEALAELVKQESFLKAEFNLQYSARKIKTNTAYLSHVVNKNLGKSFREFSTELRMDYVIKQLETNSTYRKYSTQAMAESVGYKNAVSFTKSFKKRTGLTPVQFLGKVEI